MPVSNSNGCVARCGEVRTAEPINKASAESLRKLSPTRHLRGVPTGAGQWITPTRCCNLVLGADGKGTGSAMGAAKVSFNKKKNIYEIESFQHGQSFNKLMNVQTMK
jgi:hypothetical protein